MWNHWLDQEIAELLDWLLSEAANWSALVVSPSSMIRKALDCFKEPVRSGGRTSYRGKTISLSTGLKTGAWQTVSGGGPSYYSSIYIARQAR